MRICTSTLILAPVPMIATIFIFFSSFPLYLERIRVYVGLEKIKWVIYIQRTWVILSPSLCEALIVSEKEGLRFLYILAFFLCVKKERGGEFLDALNIAWICLLSIYLS